MLPDPCAINYIQLDARCSLPTYCDKSLFHISDNTICVYSLYALRIYLYYGLQARYVFHSPFIKLIRSSRNCSQSFRLITSLPEPGAPTNRIRGGGHSRRGGKMIPMSVSEEGYLRERYEQREEHAQRCEKMHAGERGQISRELEWQNRCEDSKNLDSKWWVSECKAEWSKQENVLLPGIMMILSYVQNR